MEVIENENKNRILQIDEAHNMQLHKKNTKE